jgi:uncharacterized heparinase superfamily protein
MLNRITLWVSSVKSLKFTQLLYFIFYRALGFRKVGEPELSNNFVTTATIPSGFTSDNILDDINHTVSFLNTPVVYQNNLLPWRDTGQKRLWQYHLHYFDFLHQKNISPESKSAFLDDWIIKNPQGSQPAWEPYTASLRIVNWIQYFAIIDVKPTWHSSLLLQARWLRANLEYHILANHYFENIKALLFAAIYFRNLEGKLSSEINSWWLFGRTQLLAELQEQFLPDGGHYERSPYYHLRMINNCLELLILIRDNSHQDHILIAKLTEIVEKGLLLSANIQRPDGEIPLFNDSVLHHGINFRELTHKAQLVGVAVPQTSSELCLVAADDTGIYGAKVQNDWLMMDCGDIGPAYQPGHTHCDFLSYELMISQQMIVVDTGVFEYDPTPARISSRATAAHNTMKLNNLEQSQVWSSFRVARRAKKLWASVERQKNEILVRGAYRGFYHRGKCAVHHRHLNISLDSSGAKFSEIRVVDKMEIADGKMAKCESYLHFHPEIRIKAADHNMLTLIQSPSGKHIGTLQVEAADTWNIEEYSYSSEFGVAIPAQKLVIGSQDNGTAYRLCFVD